MLDMVITIQTMETTQIITVNIMANMVGVPITAIIDIEKNHFLI